MGEVFLLGNGNISRIEWGAGDLQISAGNLLDLEMWPLLRSRPDNLHCCFTPRVTIVNVIVLVAVTIIVIIIVILLPLS